MNPLNSVTVQSSLVQVCGDTTTPITTVGSTDKCVVWCLNNQRSMNDEEWGGMMGWKQQHVENYTTTAVFAVYELIILFR